MQKSEKIWLDGRFVDWDDAKVHVLTHTLHYGVGVFEGIRCYQTTAGRSAIFRLSEHNRRLFDSAKILGLKIPFSEHEIEKACIETVRVNKLRECYVRPIVFVGDGEMGVPSALTNPVRVSVITWPWGAYLGDEGLKNGIRVMTSSFGECVKPSRSMRRFLPRCGSGNSSRLASLTRRGAYWSACPSRRR